MEIHVVAIKNSGFAPEDAGSASTLGAFTDPQLAAQVKTLWGPSASVRPVRLNAVPEGVRSMAVELGMQLREPAESEALMRARHAHEQATPGKWKWNCAGEILATVDGQEVVIGTFEGCERDAAAVCKLHNRAIELFERAGISL